MIRGNTSHEVGGGLQNKGSPGDADQLHDRRQLGPDQRWRGVQLRYPDARRLHDQRQYHRLLRCRPDKLRANATLTNCTVSFNSARHGGGGASNTGDGPGAETTLTLTACTISGNSAPLGGGLYNRNGSTYPAIATLIDTIIALNSATGAPPATSADAPPPARHRLVQPNRRRGLGRHSGRRPGQHHPGQPRRPGPWARRTITADPPQRSRSCRAAAAAGKRTSVAGLATDQSRGCRARQSSPRHRALSVRDRAPDRRRRDRQRQRAARRAGPARGRQPGRRHGRGPNDHLRPGRLLHAADDHPDLRAA